MASTEAVVRCLSVLKHLPSDTPLTEESVAFYAIGLRGLSDDQLDRATERAVSSCTFRPMPKDLLALVAEPKPLPDVRGILERLRGMCDYHPNYGTTLPSVQRVRNELGDAIADAYGFIGPKRLEAIVFDGEGVGADIAMREFADHLYAAQKDGADITLLPSVARPMLAAPSLTLYDNAPRGGGFKRLTS